MGHLPLLLYSMDSATAKAAPDLSWKVMIILKIQSQIFIYLLEDLIVMDIIQSQTQYTISVFEPIPHNIPSHNYK